MKTDVQTRLKTLFEETVLKRKAMFIPILGVATFMLVGYAGVDHEKPEILSNHIEIPYGEKFDTDMIDIVDNHDERSELVVKANTQSLNVNQLGSYQVEVEATDQFNNVAVKTIQVDVVDDESPKIKTVGASNGYYIEVPVFGSSDLSSYLKATDNVDGDVTPFIESDKKLDTSKQGTQTLEVSVSDNSGNTTKETYKFFVADMQAPNITLKSGNDIIVNYGSEFKWQDYMTIEDNLDVNVEPQIEGKVDTKQLDQQTTLTVIVKDSAGNTSKETLNATVKDITGPEIVLSTNKVSLDKGAQVDLKSYITSAVDNLDGDMKDKVNALVEALKADGYDFTVGIPLDTPIAMADRIVSAGMGIGEKENMKLIEDLAVQAGAAIGSSRPVAETLKYVPLNRYVGMSGQKFNGNLYIACGISGAGQHLKGIKDATTIVAINTNPNAAIFKNADYGIVGDLKEVLPLLTAALDNGEPKKDAPPMKKMKRNIPKKPAPSYPLHVCNGCGYVYDPAIGDEENGVDPGTLFNKLPEDWICPLCGEEKDQFIEA